MLKLAVSCAALAAGTLFMPAGAEASTLCAPDAVETHHRAVIAGRQTAYIACVGSLPVRNLDGVATAQITYTAYLVPTPRKTGAPRPLSFVWNGGPGADSSTLQFHAVGPRVFRDGKLVDNSASPLATSDLVFVDPVGTGFSTAQSPDKASAFFGTRADIASVSGFVADWRAAYHRQNSALNLVGESFGTWRASGVAEVLVEQGIPVSGVALISGGIPLGEDPHPERRRAVSLVNRTATAFALGRLAPDLMKDRARTLAAAQHWAETVYIPALANPDALSDTQRTAVIASLARYQGLDAGAIDAKTLWVSPRAFRKGLVPGKMLDVFDMRRTDEPDESAQQAAVLAYYRHDLNYAQGHYAGIDAPVSDAGKDWQYDQSPVTPQSLARAMAGEGPPSASQPWIERAMQKAPHLRTWVAAGLYDSLNSCIGNAMTVAELPRSIGARFTLRCYEGGHMMYADPTQTLRFGNDLAAFLRGSGAK
ncbi:S10 family serine carboxypeptidase-like protein [Novosphingobium sp. 9]|uniref:S10 family serine carboxypeptidase-like protein n=1 Tax=Novosphingobium sp. 9 TaxID=2025349 RepID=UPI0021B4DBD8|nr:peptidase S10 [Novosphingobium sp. 9]